MALSITNRGTGTHNTGASSFTLSPATNCAAGATLVLCVAADNSSSGGSTNDFTTVTDSLGNTWTKRQAPVFDNGAASAGVQGAIYTTAQDVGACQTNTVITVNFGSSPVAKTWTLTEVAPAAGKQAVFRAGGDKAAGATGTAMTLGASASVNVGEVIVAAFFIEGGTSNSISTPDGDTTNGSWTTNQYAEIGTTTSGSCVVSQAKLQTTANSTQSYDVTAAVSNDYTGSYVILKEITLHTTSLATDGGSAATISAATRETATTIAADGTISAAISGAKQGFFTTLAAGGGSSIVVQAPAQGTTTALSVDCPSVATVSGATRATGTSIAASGGAVATIVGATRGTATSVAADVASGITIADATVTSGVTNHTTSLAVDCASVATISGATRATTTTLAATGQSSASIAAATRETFSSIAASGASAIVVSAARLGTFASLAVTVQGSIAADATVTKPAQEYFASADLTAVGYVGLRDIEKSRPQPKARTHERSFTTAKRGRSFRTFARVGRTRR